MDKVDSDGLYLNWRKLVLGASILSFILIVTWITPASRAFWGFIDAVCYNCLHAFFLKTDVFQKFWAVMNSRIGDNASHVIFTLLFVIYIFKESKNRWLRTRQVAFIYIAVILSIISSNVIQSQLAKIISIKRDSPSLVLGHKVALSKVLPELKNVKDSSRRSFPGDHAMTLILLTFFIFLITKNPIIRAIAVIDSIIFILPRLISGGHWITDIIMGSFPIAILAFALWMVMFSLVRKSFKHSIL